MRAHQNTRDERREGPSDGGSEFVFMAMSLTSTSFIDLFLQCLRKGNPGQFFRAPSLLRKADAGTLLWRSFRDVRIRQPELRV